MAGMTPAQVIQAAAKRSEGRAATLDQNAEFISALQEVFLDRLWWWRKVIKAFNIRAGVQRYTLFANGNDGADIDADDLHQVAKDGIKIYTGARTWVSPSPEFDTDQQQAIVALGEGQPTGRPCRYFIMGSPGTMYLDPVPDQDYTASMAYWAIPNLRADELPQEIDMLPAHLDSLVTKRLEMHFHAFCLGEGSAKYQASVGEYQKLLEMAAQYSNFAQGEIRSMASAICGDAVQSS